TNIGYLVRYPANLEDGYYKTVIRERYWFSGRSMRKRRCATSVLNDQSAKIRAVAAVASGQKIDRGWLVTRSSPVCTIKDPPRELLSLSTVILEIPEDRMTQFKEESSGQMEIASFTVGKRAEVAEWYRIVAGFVTSLSPVTLKTHRRAAMHDKYVKSLKLPLHSWKNFFLVDVYKMVVLMLPCGRGSLVVKVSDHGWHVTSSSPVPLKTRRVGARCTFNLSRAETSSRGCGVVVRRGGASSGVVLVT
ncbi:hypothetical protein TNCV_4946471, partial [Trichonephila clavipes]